MTDEVVMVPREPTEEMMRSVATYVNSRKFDHDQGEEVFREIWRVMLHAALAE